MGFYGLSTINISINHPAFGVIIYPHLNPPAPERAIGAKLSNMPYPRPNPGTNQPKSTKKCPENMFFMSIFYMTSPDFNPWIPSHA